MSFILLSLSLLLDQLFGEPRRHHPLVGFGNCANKFENWFNRHPASQISIYRGLVTFLVLVIPICAATDVINRRLGDAGWIFNVLILYSAIGFKSLLEHSKNVSNALYSNDIETARRRVSMMVSRDTKQIDESKITIATIESTLENGCDSTYGVLFWYLIGGVPFVVLYRLTNTLDAMWGYRNERFEYFGKTVAIFDDILNYAPARITALFYALCGNTKGAFRSWQKYSKLLSSPNGGPVMSSGAGSLNLQLGGPTSYHGLIHKKPYFGGDTKPVTDDILRTNTLVIRTLLLWCLTIFVLSLSHSILATCFD